ncbi:hypothetical protein [Arsenicibacter rosenii]|uniref:Uncharacterized protein n=1 Tax=Arsenicibacter rosenii TaxID=1750698 RepID=A0A1S2VPD1_9BACT|nr:hypothetical protein [Arsenicibacter rosenii]OIN60627.1 hypothetical protein BLX24_00450 [Arsenicibacter rosenii]
MHTTHYPALVAGSLLFLSTHMAAFAQQPVYQDKPYLQDFSVKYYSDKQGLEQVFTDRNGNIKIMSADGMLHPYDGQFLYPGKLSADASYRTLKNKKISALSLYDQQIVYLDDKAVLSNAWAGSLYCKHELPGANKAVGGRDFAFLITDGKALHLVRDSKTLWKGQLPGDEVVAIRFQESANSFWILGKSGLYSFNPAGNSLAKAVSGTDFTAFALTSKGNQAIIGTTDGYLTVDLATGKQVGTIQRRVPVTQITAVEEVDGRLWFGSTKGAFALRPDGRYDYYNGERWLPGDHVISLAHGPKHSVLVLTKAGLGQICFKPMTLQDKADFYEEQVRSRHIRNGFNASLDGMEKGNISTGYMSDSDNDGLWTSMYLAGEAFRYAATKDKEALQNVRESLDAMDRLYTINPVPGFPSRSFERSGFGKHLSDPERWQHAPDPEWDWKSTTSSDEVIGHIFAFGVIADIVDDKALKKQSIALIDTLMSHIVKNDMYLIDFDGKPTMWGKWNPAYVNNFPTNVGDRKLNSSNIVAMLQTAYHFTKKEKYKQKALELMTKYGYLENLMRPMRAIGQAPDNADAHAKNMSESWNHSDDEMYFVGYWGLYRYAFTDELKAKYKQAILDHWQAERPEKEGAWNIFTALTGTKDFDLPEAVWYLKEHPLDLIDWAITNSHRKDIDRLPENFRDQSTKEVLPPDERPVQRHNANMFSLDRTRNGNSEHSAGDIWLLPYWMGRYLGVISAPVSGPPSPISKK